MTVKKDKPTTAPAAKAPKPAAAGPDKPVDSVATAADAPAAPPAVVLVPGVVISGFQLREALALLAPDGTAEQLEQSVTIELLPPIGDSAAGLYASHAEYPEEGAVLLEGTVVEVSPSAVAPPASSEEQMPDDQSPSARAATYVLGERIRQVHGEGYTASSDDELTDYQLPRAAVCYAMAASGVARHKIAVLWPFAAAMKVAETRRGNLIKAAALILAELERIERDDEASA